MKPHQLLLVAALTATFTASTSNAADADRKAARKAGGADGALAQRFGANLDELGLSEDQKSKIQEYMRENGEKLRGLREDQSTSREEKMKKFQEFQTGMTAKMREILSKEQFEKWEKNRPAIGGGLAGGREGMQKILDDLNLTSEQQEKVRSAFREQMQGMQDLRNASPEERREKVQKNQDAMNAKMKEILTREQFEKWEKVRGQLGGRFAGGEGAPRKRGEKK